MEASLLLPYTVRFSFLLVRNFRESLECPFHLIFYHLLFWMFFPSKDLKQFRSLHGYLLFPFQRWLAFLDNVLFVPIYAVAWLALQMWTLAGFTFSTFLRLFLTFSELRLLCLQAPRCYVDFCIVYFWARNETLVLGPDWQPQDWVSDVHWYVWVLQFYGNYLLKKKCFL